MEHRLPNYFASWLTINRACNLRCKWCYTNPSRYQENSAITDMSLDTVRASIVLFKSLPLDRVILIGGEPTIHPNFLIIVKMIKDSGLTPVVITNGIMFKNRRFLQQALRAGIAGITTSLKGSSDVQYKRLTKRKAFGDVLKAVRNITESGIDHNLSITVGENLFDNFDEMIDAIIKSGTKWFSLEMERPMISDNLAIASSESSPQRMAEFFYNIYPKLESCGVDFVIKMSIPFCLFPENFIEMLMEKKRIVSGCHVYEGRGIIIDPMGKLLPCNHFCDNALGCLGEDFSNGAEYLKFRERIDVKEFYKTLASYPHERCQCCDYWKLCGAGCRINWLCYEATELIRHNGEGGDVNCLRKIY